MSKRIREIESALAKGESHIFSPGDIRAVRTFLKNRRRLPSKILREFLFILEHFAPHDVTPEVQAHGESMVKSFMNKAGEWRDNQETRRLRPNHRTILQSKPKFQLAYFHEIDITHPYPLYTPVFRVTSPDSQWFEYTNVPWQAGGCGIEVVNSYTQWRSIMKC